MEVFWELFLRRGPRLVYSRSRSKILRVRGDIVSFFRELSQKNCGYRTGIGFFVAFFA